MVGDIYRKLVQAKRALSDAQSIVVALEGDIENAVLGDRKLLTNDDPVKVICDDMLVTVFARGKDGLPDVDIEILPRLK